MLAGDLKLFPAVLIAGDRFHSPALNLLKISPQQISNIPIICSITRVDISLHNK